MPEPSALRATLTESVVAAIGKTLAAAMEVVASNGADSRSMPDEYVEVAAWLSSVKPSTAPAERPRNTMLEVAGKPFYCPCGCNVFQKLDPNNPNEYTCNACEATYEGN